MIEESLYLMLRTSLLAHLLNDFNADITQKVTFLNPVSETVGKGK